MTRLSLCLIARNEEAMLPGLLASVRGVVDEIVLVDTGSTDGTARLAREAGALVVTRPWDDDFAAPRNEALRHATGDWVLQLDADERLGPDAGAALRAVLESGPAFDAGLLALHNASTLDADPREVISGRARLSEPAHLPRLLRRAEGLAYEGVIHEGVLEWLAGRGMKLARVPGADIVHLGGVPEYRASRGRADRNHALLRKRCAMEPNNVVPFGYLALELVHAGRPDEAWPVIEAGWALLDRQPAHRTALRLAVARGLVQVARGDAEGVLGTVDRVEPREGAHPDLTFLRGCGLELRGDLRSPRAEKGDLATQSYEQAAAAFARCLTEPWPGALDRFVGGSAGWCAAVRLGTCLLVLGRPAEALAAFTRDLERSPARQEAGLGLVEAAIDLGDPSRALREVEPLLDAAPDGWLLAARAAMLLGSRSDAALFLRQALDRGANGLVARHRLRLARDLERALAAR